MSNLSSFGGVATSISEGIFPLHWELNNIYPHLLYFSIHQFTLPSIGNSGYNFKLKTACVSPEKSNLVWIQIRWETGRGGEKVGWIEFWWVLIHPITPPPKFLREIKITFPIPKTVSYFSWMYQGACLNFAHSIAGISLWYWWNTLVDKNSRGNSLSYFVFNLCQIWYMFSLFRLLLKCLCGIVGGIFCLKKHGRGDSISHCMFHFFQTIVGISLWYWRNILVEKE